MIKAIIFDMDGVLIDAREWHYESLNKALALFGFEISRYDHLTTFDGLPTRKKLTMLSHITNLPVGLHNFINELKQVYTANIIWKYCKPQFIHEYALSKLQSEGYKLVVASNSIRNTVSLMMNKANLDKYLNFFLSNEDVTNPKPSPEIYVKALALLHVKPQECLIVEDNPKGIQAARSSGSHVMEVSDINDVNYNNIKKAIYTAENENIQ